VVETRVAGNTKVCWRRHPCRRLKKCGFLFVLFTFLTITKTVFLWPDIWEDAVCSLGVTSLIFFWNLYNPLCNGHPILAFFFMPYIGKKMILPLCIANYLPLAVPGDDWKHSPPPKGRWTSTSEAGSSAWLPGAGISMFAGAGAVAAKVVVIEWACNPAYSPRRLPGDQFDVSSTGDRQHRNRIKG
jgi:hypothetical protein